MTYPISSDVSAGQPTAAAHYNNLRADALRLGAGEADGTALGSLLGRYAWGLRLEVLDGSRVRLLASPAEPAALVIGGVPLATTANVDLPVGGVPGGAAALYYLFAVRSTGSTAFTLEVNTSAGESSTRRRIGRFYWDGGGIMPDSLRAEDGLYGAAAPLPRSGLPCQGRLTLTSGDPLPAGDVTSAGTLYFTPCGGNRVALYQPGLNEWVVRAFGEISVSLSGRTAGKNYDVFVYDAGGSLRLELVAWSSDTVRGAALGQQDGVWVRAGSPEKRYLGVVRLHAAGLAADSRVMRHVWNQENRRPRPVMRLSIGASWTYATAGVWRDWANDSSAVRVSAVLGSDDSLVNLRVVGRAKSSASTEYAVAGLGVDSAAANSAALLSPAYGTAPSALLADYCAMPGTGYHFFAPIEYISGGTGTFYGPLSVTEVLGCGVLGWVTA